MLYIAILTQEQIHNLQLLMCAELEECENKAIEIKKILDSAEGIGQEILYLLEEYKKKYNIAMICLGE